jgi:hypothetical protein
MLHTLASHQTWLLRHVFFTGLQPNHSLSVYNPNSIGGDEKMNFLANLSAFGGIYFFTAEP